MKRRAYIICLKFIGLPRGLPGIIADYVSLTKEERLRQMFQHDKVIRIADDTEIPNEIYLHRTGFDVFEVKTSKLMCVLCYIQFIDLMMNVPNSRYNIIERINNPSECCVLEQLLIRASDFWWSI